MNITCVVVVTLSFSTLFGPVDVTVASSLDARDDVDGLSSQHRRELAESERELQALLHQTDNTSPEQRQQLVRCVFERLWL